MNPARLVPGQVWGDPSPVARAGGRIIERGDGGAEYLRGTVTAVKKEGLPEFEGSVDPETKSSYGAGWKDMIDDRVRPLLGA
ncbi:MAG: hypothetical protein NT080_07775 [Spirochaetes bacterium]|nr:hypothetical protein [Spirochaetota bacterium]